MIPGNSKKMKKVLIVLENNYSSKNIACTGYMVAQSLQAEITLVNVVAESKNNKMNYTVLVDDRGSSNMKKTLNNNDNINNAEIFLDAFVRYLKDPRIETKVLVGNTTKEILKYANEWEIDLIITGAEHHKGLDRLFIIDDAANLFKHSSIPLLTIPSSLTNLNLWQ